LASLRVRAQSRRRARCSVGEFALDPPYHGLEGKRQEKAALRWLEAAWKTGFAVDRGDVALETKTC
jgi:hypothetical protein